MEDMTYIHDGDTTYAWSDKENRPTSYKLECKVCGSDMFVRGDDCIECCRCGTGYDIPKMNLQVVSSSDDLMDFCE